LKKRVTLLALILLTAPLVGALSADCVCEDADDSASALIPVSCCSEQTHPCCCEEKSTHGEQPLVAERNQENRLEWKPTCCLGAISLSEPLASAVRTLGAMGSRGPPIAGVDVQRDLQVWLI